MQLRERFEVLETLESTLSGDAIEVVMVIDEWRVERAYRVSFALRSWGDVEDVRVLGWWSTDQVEHAMLLSDAQTIADLKAYVTHEIDQEHERLREWAGSYLEDLLMDNRAEGW